MAEITLEFLGRQIERVINDVANIRDDITVLTAISTRLETSVQTLTVEIRAMQRQFARMNDRVSRLEDAAGH